MSTEAMDPDRQRLVEHVQEVQRTIRTCEGCGLCCTEAHNSVRILPFEAARIAQHLRALPEARRDELARRMTQAITRYAMRTTGKVLRYTCPFLEADLSCALPFDVKPVACLSFNPRTPDDCSMENKWFAAAHRHAEHANAAAGWPDRRLPIPLAVRLMLEDRVPHVEAAPPDAPVKVRTREPAAIYLPRLLSKWHVASRKQAEAMVRGARVSVNGVVRSDILFKVRPERDHIAVDGKPVTAPDPAAAFQYVVLNKPRGVVTTTHDPEGRPTVMDLAPAPPAPGLGPVGRLDQDSAGLLLLTNDHDLADRLLSPTSHVTKVYRVKVRGHPAPETLHRLQSEAMIIDGVAFAPIGVEVESTGPRSSWLRITLKEGKNRQIRRQLSFVGHDVETLIRTAFGPLTLGELTPGSSRTLEPAEITALRASVKPR